MNTQGSFSAYMPLTLSKSVSKDGKEILKMSGVMSSTSRDTDGQILDPNGFNMDPIMNGGYMNWHHQSNKNPMALIGKPTSYRLDKSSNQMHLDFELFSENPMAQQVYQLQKVLEGQGLSLGLSLEGTATKFRDETTKDYVEKADITGCAVTPAPKNRDAIVQLMKGITNEFQLIKGDIISEGPGSEIGDGKHPLAKESLDGVKKVVDEEEEEEEEILTKSEVIDIVGKKFPGSTYDTLEKFFNFTLELEKSNKTGIMESKTKKEGVSPDALNKALEDLGLLKGEEVKEIEGAELKKSATPEDRLDILEKGMVEIISLLKKGKDSAPVKKAEEEEEEEEGEEKLEKAKAPVKEEEEEEEEKPKKLEKASSDPDLIKGMIEGLENVLGAKMDSFNESLEKANANFTEALGINEALTSKLEKAQEDIEDLKGQSLGRRTVTTSKFLKKGNEEEEAKLNVLSARTDKRLICDTLEKACIQDGKIVDQRLANAVMQFEQSNVVTDPLIKGLLKDGYTLGN